VKQTDDKNEDDDEKLKGEHSRATNALKFKPN